MMMNVYADTETEGVTVSGADRTVVEHRSITIDGDRRQTAHCYTSYDRLSATTTTKDP